MRTWRRSGPVCGGSRSSRSSSPAHRKRFRPTPMVSPGTSPSSRRRRADRSSRGWAGNAGSGTEVGPASGVAGERPEGLRAEKKPLRGPAGEQAGLVGAGQGVVGGVDLHGGEAARVVGEGGLSTITAVLTTCGRMPGLPRETGSLADLRQELKGTTGAPDTRPGGPQSQDPVRRGPRLPVPCAGSGPCPRPTPVL